MNKQINEYNNQQLITCIYIYMCILYIYIYIYKYTYIHSMYADWSWKTGVPGLTTDQPQALGALPKP